MLAAGVVDTIDPQPESVDAVRGRIEKLLAGIPEDRLIVTADAGMRGLAADAAEAKTRALVEAAAAF
ncbi:MAG: hypothetical protein GTO30_03740 [Acidobacteria bacterium]|nr:hypothetical protein [Acidobacteriota bacterium]NIQ83461.1 hypothetical protein [Acidobacteriota bacterium]